jgi:hypothetical protein
MLVAHKFQSIGPFVYKFTKLERESLILSIDNEVSVCVCLSVYVCACLCGCRGFTRPGLPSRGVQQLSADIHHAQNGPTRVPRLPQG